MRFYFVVTQEESSGKLASFLKNKMNKDLSLRKIKRWIDAGYCVINKKIERFHHTVVHAHDCVQLTVPDLEITTNAQALPQALPLILFEDSDILVCDKPAGFICD